MASLPRTRKRETKDRESHQWLTSDCFLGLGLLLVLTMKPYYLDACKNRIGRFDQYTSDML